MSKYKVYVYAICKNEKSFVRRWMESMSEADGIIVTDTGSSDGTPELLRKLGAEVYEEKIDPWRFDLARNISLEHVPKEADICVCTDLDELLRPGWRKCLEEAWTQDAAMGHYLYNWSIGEDGTPYTQFIYFKAHCRGGYRWKYPVHECLEYIGDGPEKKVFINGMVLDHYPDKEKSRSSYLPLLKMGAEEMPQDSRMSYYLGREYMYAGSWDMCINELLRYLSLPSAKWAEERCAAMRWIAKSYEAKENTDEAMKWYHRAIAEQPGMRDAYIECAKMCYRLSDWTSVYYMTERALRINKKSDYFVNAGYAWDYTPYDLAAIACYHLGMLNASLEYAKKALDTAPEDERLKNNLQIIRQKAEALEMHKTDKAK